MSGDGKTTWAKATRQIVGRPRAMQGVDQIRGKLSVRLSSLRDTMIAPLQRIKPRLEGDPGHAAQIRELLVGYKNAATFLNVDNTDEALRIIGRLEKQYPAIVEVFRKETVELRGRIAALVADVPRARTAASQPNVDPAADGKVKTAEQALIRVQGEFAESTVKYTVVTASLVTAEAAAREAFLVVKGLSKAASTVETLTTMPPVNVARFVDKAVCDSLRLLLKTTVDFWNEDALKDAASHAVINPGFGKKNIVDEEYLKIVAKARSQIEALRDPGPVDKAAISKAQTQMIFCRDDIARKKEAITKAYSDTSGKKHKRGLSLQINTLVDLDMGLENLLRELAKAESAANTERDRLVVERRKELAGQMNDVHDLIDSLIDPAGTACADDHARKLISLLTKDEVTAQVILGRRHNSEAVAKLLNATPAKVAEKFLEPLITAHLGTPDYLDELTEKLLIADIHREANVEAVLRANTVGTKFAAKYNKVSHDGKNYISDAMTGTALALTGVDVSGPHGLEIDPVRMEGDEPSKEVLDKHREVVEAAIKSITDAVPPPEVSKACATIYDEYLERLRTAYGTEIADHELQSRALKMVGGHVVLRLVAPQMATFTSPSDRDVDKDKLKRFRTIQSKLLQNVSNQTTGTQKEPFMSIFSDVVLDGDGNPAEATVALQEYFRQVVREGKKAKGDTLTSPITATDAGTLRDNWQSAFNTAKSAFTTIANGMRATKRPVSIRIAAAVENIRDDLSADLTSTLALLATEAGEDPVDVDEVYDTISQARRDIAAIRKVISGNKAQIKVIEKYPSGPPVDILVRLTTALNTVWSNLP